MCLRGQHQTELTAGAIGHAGDFPGKFACGLTPEGQCAPEAVHQAGQYPVRRQRSRQHLIHTRYPLTPAEYPPRPLRTVRRQINMRTQAEFFRQSLPEWGKTVTFIQFRHAAAHQPE